MNMSLELSVSKAICLKICQSECAKNNSEKRRMMKKRVVIQGIRSSVCPRGEFLGEYEKTDHFDRVIRAKIINYF